MSFAVVVAGRLVGEPWNRLVVAPSVVPFAVPSVDPSVVPSVDPSVDPSADAVVGQPLRQAGHSAVPSMTDTADVVGCPKRRHSPRSWANRRSATRGCT